MQHFDSFFHVEHLVACKLFRVLPFDKNTSSTYFLQRLLVVPLYCFYNFLFIYFFPAVFWRCANRQKLS